LELLPDESKDRRLIDAGSGFAYIFVLFLFAHGSGLATTIAQEYSHGASDRPSVAAFHRGLNVSEGPPTVACFGRERAVDTISSPSCA
jgi:hypothetical protein